MPSHTFDMWKCRLTIQKQDKLPNKRNYCPKILHDHLRTSVHFFLYVPINYTPKRYGTLMPRIQIGDKALIFAEPFKVQILCLICSKLTAIFLKIKFMITVDYKLHAIKLVIQTQKCKLKLLLRHLVIILIFLNTRFVINM